MRRLVALSAPALAVACQAVTGDFSVGTGAVRTDASANGDSGVGVGDSAAQDSGGMDGRADAPAGASSGGGGSDGSSNPESGPPVDSGGNDTGRPGDAVAEAPAETGPPPTYSAFGDPAQWETFDMQPVGGQQYAIGGAFDGHFVYYTPGQENGTNMVRYDTSMSFTMPNAWSFFNVTNVAGGPYIYNGAAFDGRFIYLTPDLTEDANTIVGGVVRYDTTQLFGMATSWSVFDTTSITKQAAGYEGAVFDGTYLYFAPCYGTTSARFKAGSTFSDPMSWSTFATTNVDANADGFRGAAFDGRYIYYAPYVGNRSAAAAGLVARYDTTSSAGFAAKAAWSSFDISTLNAGAVGFAGAVFDGGHVVFVPNSGAVAARFDTQQSLSAPGAWEFFDLSPTNPGTGQFYGGTFDGRYVYLAPDAISGGKVTAVRFDSTRPFSNAASWETFNVLGAGSGVTGFNGAVFDGAYVYFVPIGSTVTARFHARTPAGLAPYSNASFL
jgi:hypothetical protein